jgi:homoserine O-acetyltransferase
MGAMNPAVLRGALRVPMSGMGPRAELTAMNTSPDTPPSARQSGPGAASLREGILDIPGTVSLFHGASLAGVRVAWRLEGAAGAPVVAALGGISAHRRVFAAEEPRLGWWSEVAGPGGALDSAQLRLLSFDYLGGNGETTGPRRGEVFPSISTYDQAEILLRLLNHLGIKALRSIAGASYGAMVGLAFAERYPERVSHLFAISGADRTHPMATAWRSVQRRIVRFGLDCARPTEGLELARALAMSTYRSPEEFAARFSAAPRRGEDGRFVFPVEDYLTARGSDWASRFIPEAFVCLSESIDLHRVEAARVFVPTTAVAVREDQLVPLSDMRAMVARLPEAKLHEISSVYGHDAFLKEAGRLRPIFGAVLGGTQ